MTIPVPPPPPYKRPSRFREHRTPLCDLPEKKRRFRNMVYVCPTCGQAWTLVYNIEDYTTGVWEWVRWNPTTLGTDK